jgi:hypothetical protein
MVDTRNAELVTHKHIARVRELLSEFAIEMIRRGNMHDRSKFDPVELIPLAKMQEIIDHDGPAQFGTEEYKRRTAMLGSMISHHRQCNSHHPEYYEFELGGDCLHGINGMDLFDVVEMFFDWKAASERGEDTCMRLTEACDKYKITGPLRYILFNTAERLGYRADAQLGGQDHG